MQGILDMIFSKYSSDMVSLLPSCGCDNPTVGEFAIGTICPNCNSEVKAKLEEDIEPMLWLRCPHGVDSLINPHAWLVMSKIFMKASFNTLQWITDTTYRPPNKPPEKLLEEIEEAGIERGYNYFIREFDSVMDRLMNLKMFRNKRNDINDLRVFLKNNRDVIFSKYLPMQNKMLLVIEKTSVGTYIDPNITLAANAINMLIGIDTEDLKDRVKENRVAKAITRLAFYYESYYRDNYCGKPGMLRKHMFGTRSQFSFRTVISSSTEAHDYDEIHIPWSVGVTMLELHIMNRLLKMGYTLNTAKALLMEHISIYNPVLDDIMKDLIADSPYNGIVGLFNRFPSLLAGSIQCLRITRVKTDVNDNTTSLSDIILVAFNADFDGDAMSFTAALDNYMADLFYNLAPHKNIFLLNEPGKISDNIRLPKPIVATIANWFRIGLDNDPYKRERMIKYGASN
jgi:hypothetical protein